MFPVTSHDCLWRLYYLLTTQILGNLFHLLLNFYITGPATSLRECVWQGLMLFGTLTYTLGCFPLDIRPYHRTSETILLNSYSHSLLNGED